VIVVEPEVNMMNFRTIAKYVMKCKTAGSLL